MDEYKIRPMKKQDISQVYKIEKKTFSMPWSEKSFEDSLMLSDTCYLVAESGKKICGYCGYYQSIDEADIVNVAVEACSRGKGIATALLKHLMEFGNSQGVTAFTLEVRESNMPAIALYESLGFQNVGKRKNFYDFPKEDAYIFWKHKL